MVEISKRFKKKLRQATASKGKRVVISAEAKQAYEDEMRAREERDRTYTRHLPGPDNKAGR